MKDYSLYTYYCGALKIYGNKSKRAKYSSIDEALGAFFDYEKRLERINKKSREDNFQVLIVEYTDSYQSKIVGIIDKDNVNLFGI